MSINMCLNACFRFQIIYFYLPMFCEPGSSRILLPGHSFPMLPLVLLLFQHRHCFLVAAVFEMLPGLVVIYYHFINHPPVLNQASGRGW